MIPIGVLGGARVAADGGGFLPTDIANLALWLDAADASTITASGSPALVSQWNDKSGNARHATSGGSYQPKTGTRTLGGRNVMAYENTRTHLTTAPYGLTNGAAMTWFVVWDLDSQVDFIIAATSSVNFYKGAAQSGVATAHSAFWSGDIYINGSVLGGTRADVYSAANGRAVVARWAGALNGTAAYLTAYPSASFNNAGGHAETIAYMGTLSAGDIAAVESYLYAKWGITP